MAVRPKTRRRLVILLVCTLGIGAAGGGAYVIRKSQLNHKAVAALADGRRALGAGDYFNAMHLIGRYVQRFPNDPDSLYQYAVARQNVPEKDNSNIAGAINLYRRVLVLKPTQNEARQKLLDLYLQAGFSTEARELADEMLKTGPDARALRAKVIASQRLRQFDQAVAAALQLAQVAPDDLEAQILVQQALLAKGEAPAQVLNRAQKLQQAHPQDPRYQILLSIAYRAANDPQQSAVWIKKAAQTGVDDAASTLILADELVVHGLFDESVNSLERAAKRSADPKLQKALISRLWQLGRDQEVVDRLANLEAADSKVDCDLLGYRALSLMHSGKTSESQAIISQLEARKADFRGAAWGAVLKQAFAQPSPDHKELLQAATSAIRLDAANPCFHFYGGEAYAAVGEPDLALEQWKSAARTGPAWPLPWIRISQSYSRRGDRIPAIQAASAAVARAPKDATALASFVVAGVPVMDAAPDVSSDKLLKMIDQIQSIAPGEEQTLPLKVLILLRTNKKDAAVAAIQIALNLPKAPSERALLELAAVSRSAKLGAENACFELSQKTHGLSPALALTRAQILHEEGHASDARKVMEEGRAAAGGDPKGAWALAWAQYLEVTSDPAAKQTWADLATQRASDLQVQQAVLAARSVQSDREFVAQCIERLHAISGDQSTVWRLAKARWVLRGTPSERELSEVTTFLSEMTRNTPDLVAPRLLLAAALEKLGNLPGATEQLTIAARLQPERLVTTLELARLRQQQREFAAAKDLLESVGSNPVASTGDRAQAARLLEQQGEAAAALKLLQGSSEKATSTSDELLLASLYRKQNEPSKAEAIYQRLLKTPDAAIVEAAVEFFAAQGRADEAEKTLRLLDPMQLKPGTKDLVWAGYYEHTGKLDQAIARYQAAMKSISEPASQLQVRRRLIAVQIMVGKGSEAASSLSEAVTQHPQDPVLQRLSQNKDLISVLASDAVLRPLLLTLASESDAQAASEALRLIAQTRSNPEPAHSLAIRLRPLADRNQKVLPLQLLLAQIYAESGAPADLAQAVTLATRAAQTFPGSREAAQAAATALSRDPDRRAEALAAAKRWRELSLGNPMAPDLLTAQTLMQMGRPQEALTQLEPYLSKAQGDPDNHALVLVSAARAHLMLSHPEPAAQLLRPQLKRSAEWRRAWMQLVTGYPDARVAASWLDEVAPLVDNSSIPQRLSMTEAWLGVSRTSGDPQHAEKYKQMLAKLTGDIKGAPSPRVEELMVVASLNEQAGQPEPAEALYRRALQVQPSMAVAMNNLAMILVRRHDHLDEAVQLASKASDLNPGIPDFLDSLASAYAANKDYDRALQCINNAIKIDPERLAYRLNLIEIYADKGQVDRARSEFQQLERTRVDLQKLDSDLRAQFERVRRKLSLPAAG